mgnify:CR=1 FL=1
MKRYRLLLTLLLLLPALPVLAQIQLTEADARSYYNNQVTLTTHSTEDATPLQGLLNATGANQTWDFRGATYTSMEVETGEMVSPPVPGSDHFSTANVIQKFGGKDAAGQDSVAYIFTRLDAAGMTVLGMVFISDFDEETPGVEQLMWEYDPGLLAMKFPLQHNTSWTSDVTLSYDFAGFPITAQFRLAAACEGWGTLITPAGSYDALRCRMANTTTMFGITSSVTSIDFITRSAAGASLTLDDAGNLIEASYTSSSGGGGGVATEPPAELPGGFALDQNYPNPFNPATVIPFTLSEGAHVTLKVYDALGREVATLVEGFRAPGTHRVTWRADGLPSGPYLYRLDVAGRPQSRTLVLQK